MDSETLKAELARAKAQLAQAGGLRESPHRQPQQEINSQSQVAAQAQADLNRERAERYRSLAQRGPLQDQR